MSDNQTFTTSQIATYDKGCRHTDIFPTDICQVLPNGEVFFRSRPLQKIFESDMSSFEFFLFLYHEKDILQDPAEIVRLKSLFLESYKSLLETFTPLARTILVFHDNTLSLEVFSSCIPHIRASAAKAGRVCFDNLESPDARIESALYLLAGTLCTLAISCSKDSHPAFPEGIDENTPNLYEQLLHNALFGNLADTSHKIQSMRALAFTHAEHGITASIFAGSVAGSTHASYAASLSAAFSALSGDLHGGANQEVIAMFNDLSENAPKTDDPKDIEAYVRSFLEGFFQRKKVAKEEGKPSPKIFGLGHAIYKKPEKRASLLREVARMSLDSIDDTKQTKFRIAKCLEHCVNTHSYFHDRGVHPNIDFWAAILMDQLDIAPKTFPAIFGTLMTMGLLSHLEENQHNKIPLIRPPGTTSTKTAAVTDNASQVQRLLKQKSNAASAAAAIKF